MEIIKYPDRTSYAKIKLAGQYEIPTVSSFTHRLNSYEDLWHLNQIVDVYRHLEVKPTITIPCLIDAQADRRFNKDESSGLKLVCKFLNGMWANFKIFHPHNSEVVESLIDNVEIIDNSEFVQKCLNYIEREFHKEYPLSYNFKDESILMSSDAGGFKPLMKLCDKIGWQGETVSASKARRYEDGKTTLHQIVPIKDFDGKDILIIDDICIYGGTFKGLSKLLKDRNCGKLYLATSHMTVENLGEDPVTNYFDTVFTTNSKYDNYFTKDSEAGGKQPDNLTIINMF